MSTSVGGCINPPFWFVFDVESIGLHGEGFSVGVVVIDSDGYEPEAVRYSCPPSEAKGDDDGRLWVAKNCPIVAMPTHPNPEALRDAFWHFWGHWKGHGAIMAADCPWPVEARFLAACVDQEPDRAWRGPYPLIDVASVLVACGIDPMQEFPRIAGETPIHDALADARQSARLLTEALKK